MSQPNAVPSLSSEYISHRLRNVYANADAASLEAWRSAKRATSNSTGVVPDQSTQIAGNHSAIEQTLAFLDLHLPHWDSAPSSPLPLPPVTTVPTKETASAHGPQSPPAFPVAPTTSMGDRENTSAVQPRSPTLVSDGNRSVSLLQQDLTIAAALIEASVTSPDNHSTTTVTVPAAASGQGESSGSGSRGKKRCSSEMQTATSVSSGSGMAQKRSKLEQQLERCWGIIRRFRNRGGVMPRHQKRVSGAKKSSRSSAAEPSTTSSPRGQNFDLHQQENDDLELDLEHQDAAKLKCWKQAVVRECNGSKGSSDGSSSSIGEASGSGGVRQGQHSCPAEVRELLDTHMPLWRDASLKKAHGIVERYVQRGGILPREWRDRQNCPVREQEYQDANKLKHWKQAMR